MKSVNSPEQFSSRSMEVKSFMKMLLTECCVLFPKYFCLSLIYTFTKFILLPSRILNDHFKQKQDEKLNPYSSF
jgi:hypothetical protein